MDFTYISSFLSQVKVRMKSTRIKTTVKLALYSNRVKLKSMAGIEATTLLANC